MQPNIILGKQAVLDLLLKSPEQIEVVWIQSTRKKDIRQILKLCQNKNVKYQFVPKEKLDKLSPKKHNGIAAKVFIPGFVDEFYLISQLETSPLPVILALDEVQDQGNIGAMARTLYACGGTGIVITKFRSAQLGERAIKSSCGALLHLPVSRVSNLKNFLKLCHENNVNIYYGGMDKNSQDLYKAPINFPLVLVLGNEEKGVKPTIKNMCNMGLKIPMLRPFDSLNVAQASGIFIGEFLSRWLRTKTSL